jgi:hypothetical protein
MQAYSGFTPPSPFPQGRTSGEIWGQPRVQQWYGLKVEPSGRAHQAHPVNLGVRNVALSKVWSLQPVIICCNERNVSSNCLLLHYRHVELLSSISGPGYRSRYSGWLRVDRPGFELRYGQEIFLFSKTSRPALGLTQNPEVYYSPTSIVPRLWMLPLCVFMAWTVTTSVLYRHHNFSWITLSVHCKGRSAIFWVSKCVFK